MLSIIKRYRVILVSFLLAIFSLHLALTDTRVSERGYLVKRLISAAVAPVQNAAVSLYRGAESVANGYILLYTARKESERYREALVKLKQENLKLREKVRLGERLETLLEYSDAVPFETGAASVVSYNTSHWTKTAVINRGSMDGLKKDMAVITPAGVAGRIIEVTPATSTVLLNTDPRSNIEALVERTRVRTIAEGNGSDGILLKYIRELDDVVPGDLVITSGFSGIFPKGLVIGEVTAVKKGRDNFFKVVEVTPSVDFKRLEDVLVVTGAGPTMSEKTVDAAGRNQ